MASSASTPLGRGSASGSLARFELSAQARRRSEDLAPAASTTSKRSAMLAHPSTELVARAPCQLRRAHARSVRAVRARLRQQRRLEVDETHKRGVQTGGVAGGRRVATTTLAFDTLDSDSDATNPIVLRLSTIKRAHG